MKDTSFGKKSCNFEHGLETKNEFEKWPLITFFQCIVQQIGHCMGVTSRIRYWVWSTLSQRYTVKRFKLENKNEIRICLIHIGLDKIQVSGKFVTAV